MFVVLFTQCLITTTIITRSLRGYRFLRYNSTGPRERSYMHIYSNFLSMQMRHCYLRNFRWQSTSEREKRGVDLATTTILLNNFQKREKEKRKKRGFRWIPLLFSAGSAVSVRHHLKSTRRKSSAHHWTHSVPPKRWEDNGRLFVDPGFIWKFKICKELMASHWLLCKDLYVFWEGELIRFHLNKEGARVSAIERNI